MYTQGKLLYLQTSLPVKILQYSLAIGEIIQAAVEEKRVRK
jgi:hypothetical protein